MLHLLGHQPYWFFVAVPLTALTGIPIVAGILSWCASGRLDAVPAAGLIVIAGGLWAGAFYAPLLWVSFVCLGALVCGAGYALYVLMMEGRVGMRKLLAEQLERYAAAVRANPTNIAARTYLAATLYQLGRLDEAIDHMDYAVKIAAPTIVADEKRALARWTREKRVRDLGLVVCPSCYGENPAGVRRCESCGASLTASDWLKSGDAQRLLWTALGAAAIVAAGWLLSRVVPGTGGMLVVMASVATALVFFLVRLGKPQAG
jgi:tetratricopeptide (TPR) repeat protein